MINLKRSKKPPLIPMSSMSDIGFLLLIFIMLISLINQRHEVKIDYSEAKVLERTQEPENLEIWVERNGRISVDGKVVALDDLEQLIAGTLAYQPSAACTSSRTETPRIGTSTRSSAYCRHCSTAW
jgi:biopolymer transport protein ExbD